MIATTI